MGWHSRFYMAGSSWHVPRVLPPARCRLKKLCQGSMRCVRQHTSMETRFPMETQFTFDEISCYSIKVFPEAYGTWTFLSHLPQPRGTSLCSQLALGWQRVPELGAQPHATIAGLGQLCGDGTPPLYSLWLDHCCPSLSWCIILAYQHYLK